jgi:hypothetical protein
VILTATMSFAAAAGAQPQDEEPAATDESRQPDYLPPGPPQAEFAPGASPAPLPPPAADIGFGTPGQIVVTRRATMDLVSKLEGVDTTKTTDIGLMSTIGGYFGP